MTKRDLRNFMVVETRDGRKFMVNADDGVLFKENSYLAYTDFNEDLTNINCFDGLDIVKVFQHGNKYKYHFCVDSWDKMEKIWERKEETVLTMQEIADKFNIPVGSLKIMQ